MNDLVIKITGNVESSNFSKYKKDALKMIKKADMPLVSDQDFVDAGKLIKNCQAAEDMIASAKNGAMEETVDISKLFADLDEIAAAVRKTRLSLDKKVKSEKEKRKGTLINSFICKIVKQSENLELLPQHSLLNNQVFHDAAKGKKTTATMTASLQQELDAEMDRLQQTKDRVTRAYGKIEKVEQEYPGLFEDRDSLVMGDEQYLDSEIEKRVLKMKEGVRQKAEEDKRKAEEKEQQQETAELTREPFVEPRPIPQAPKPQVKTPAPQKSAPKETGNRAFMISVELLCNVDQARAMAKKIDTVFGSEGAVKTIGLKAI